MMYLASRGLIAPKIGSTVLSLEIGEAMREAGTMAENSTRADTLRRQASTSLVTAQFALGKLLLLDDNHCDAEEAFAHGFRFASDANRKDTQVVTCLAKGLLSLNRDQLRTAWSCLRRAYEIKDTPPELHLQAGAALSALFFRLGMRTPAEKAARQCLAMLDTGDDGNRKARAQMEVMLAEFAALDLLRQHPRLNDLVFWPQQTETLSSPPDLARVLQTIDTAKAAALGMKMLTGRLGFLQDVLQKAYGPESSTTHALAHIEQFDAAGLHPYADAARHELALACCAAKDSGALEVLMSRYQNPERRKAVQVPAFEHDYCMAKLGELKGRQDLYIDHFRRYTANVLRQLRGTCAYGRVPEEFQRSSKSLIRDEIASRLPSRYRRAYQFILEDLTSKDLSVRKIAIEIGVTERALQLVFKANLGLTPSQLIRQCRMDRIRIELRDGALNSGRSTLDVGRQWGVQSRSTLAQGYREAFGELPGQTLQSSPYGESP